MSADGSTCGIPYLFGISTAGAIYLVYVLIKRLSHASTYITPPSVLVLQGSGLPRLCTRQDYAGQVLWVSILQYNVPARFLPTRDTITPFFAAFEGADKKGGRPTRAHNLMRSNEAQ